MQDCFGSGILMFCDAAFLGGLTVVKMWRMDVRLTLLALIPMALLLFGGVIIGKYMTKNGKSGRRRFPICPISPRRAFPASPSSRRS